MALTPISNLATVYQGEQSKEFILKSLVGGETLSINGIKIKEDVKTAWRPRKFGTGNLLVSGGTGAHDFSGSGSIVISETSFLPKRFKINLELPFSEFSDLADAIDLGAGQNAQDVPAEFHKALNQTMVEKTAQEIEMALWTGNTAIGIVGIIPDAKIGNVTISAATPTTITASNVVGEMYKMKNVLPNGVKKKGNKNLVYIVPYSTADFYRQSQSALGLNTTQADQALTIHGVEIVPVGGLPANKMWLLERSNLGVATDLTSDFNEVRVLDMRETTGDDKVRYILRGSVEAKIIEKSEAVFYNG